MISIIQVDSAHIQQLRDLLDEYLKPMREAVAESAMDVNAIPTFKNLDDEIATLPGIFATVVRLSASAAVGDTLIRTAKW